MIREAQKQKGQKATSYMSTLLLERMFQGSKKFMQLTLKPKNPSFNKKSERGSENISNLKA